MADPNFTPGPWQISRDGLTVFADGANPEITIRGVTQNIPQLAHILRNGFGAMLSEQAANAHLIAAAPEMYEALASLRDTILAFEGDLQARGLPAQIAIDAVFEKAKAALSKAEGR